MELNYIFDILGVILAWVSGLLICYLGSAGKGWPRIFIIAVGILLIIYGGVKLVQVLNTLPKNSGQSSSQPKPQGRMSPSPLPSKNV